MPPSAQKEGNQTAAQLTEALWTMVSRSTELSGSSNPNHTHSEKRCFSRTGDQAPQHPERPSHRLGRARRRWRRGPSRWGQLSRRPGHHGLRRGSTRGLGQQQSANQRRRKAGDTATSLTSQLHVPAAESGQSLSLHTGPPDPPATPVEATNQFQPRQGGEGAQNRVRPGARGRGWGRGQ